MWQYILVAIIVAAAAIWLLRRSFLTIRRAFKPGGQPVSCQGCPNNTDNKASARQKAQSPVKMLVNLQRPTNEKN